MYDIIKVYSFLCVSVKTFLFLGANVVHGARPSSQHALLLDVRLWTINFGYATRANIEHTKRKFERWQRVLSVTPSSNKQTIEGTKKLFLCEFCHTVLSCILL